MVLFFAGSFVGSLFAHSSKRSGPVLTLALVILGIGTALILRSLAVESHWAMLPLALSAGGQNAVLQPLGAARLGATFVTGTLFSAGQDLARAVIGTAPALRWLQHMLIWASLCLGALLGAVGLGWRCFHFAPKGHQRPGVADASSGVHARRDRTTRIRSGNYPLEF